ncbi:MAG: ECF-type sigma factor [Pseudomonadales bacterium]
MAAESDLTSLLQAWSAGDEQALDALTPMVYGELHAVAMRLFKGEQAGHTMQPTALVNEVYEKLIGVEVSWQDRAHFFALSARMMRRLLVNHANARKAEKRGGEAINVTFEEMHHAAQPADTGILKLEDALLALAEFDQQQADLIELQYFAGLSFKEMQEVTGLSSSTLDRHLRMARAWLKANMVDEA